MFAAVTAALLATTSPHAIERAILPFPMPMLTVSGSTAPVVPSFVRSSGTTVGSGTTVTVAFPGGSAAGDRVLIHLSGAFAATTPSGWFCLVQSQGTNINCAIITKILTSGDISTGNVVVTFAGTGSILAEWTIFVGAPIVHGTSVGRDVSNGATLASWTASATGDVVFWYAGTVSASAAPTINRGADLQVTTGAPWGRITFETLTGSGSVTATFNNGGVGSFTVASAAVAPATTSSLAIRGTRVTSFSGSSVVYTFPAGSAAGDKCIICAAQAFSVTTPAGWASLDNQTGTNVNGGIFHKTLTSGDISTGSVTISFGGSFNGNIQGITFVGAPSSIRTTLAVRSSSTSNPGVTVTTGASPVAGDIAIFFGSCRAPTTQSFPTVNRGSTLENNNDANFPGVVATEVLTASGAVSAAIGYCNSKSLSSTTGAYSGIVVVTP